MRRAERMSVLRRLRAIRIPRVLVVLSGLMMGAIGSCSLPSINPPRL